MTSPADRFAAAAEALAGARFVLHGRDPEHGLDCIGLVACALERAGLQSVPPSGYRLRNADIAPFLAAAAQSGFVTAQDSPIRRGDLLLLRPGPAQHHLTCATGPADIVHAHAGLGRVVVQPLPGDWPIAAHWRLVPKHPEI